MSTDNEHNARHDRLEEALQQLTAAALKHDMMLEMLQAMQRDQAIDIQEHKETQNQIKETQDRIVAVLEQLSSMMLKVIDTQQDHAASLRRHEEIQQDHAASIRRHEETQQQLAAILRRLTENGNSGP